MRIGFVSSPIYPERIRRLVENEFDYIDVSYLTYEVYSDAVSLVSERQREFDALLFSGRFAYYYCCEHCRQEIPWLCVKRFSTTLANTLREARFRGYDITNVSADIDTRMSVESAYWEAGVNPATVSLHIWTPPPLQSGLDSYLESALEFHRQCIAENYVTCCITSTLWVYKKLLEAGAPVVFVELSFDTFRSAFYQLYLQITERANDLAQLAVLMVESDLPREYSPQAQNEMRHMKRRLRMTERVYDFAERLQAIVNEVSDNQYQLISTRAAFESETQDMQQFELFERVNNDARSTVYFGIGFGRTAVEGKRHAYLALERAKALGRNTACLVAANGELISTVHYIKPKKGGRPGALPEDKLTLLSKRSGISVKRLLQLYAVVESCQTAEFTSAQLAEQLGISKRNMDRIILRLESAGLSRVVGQRIEGALGRPSRLICLLLEQ